MTICVPKKPFEVGLKILYHCFLWSWIPILGLLIYANTFPTNKGIILLALPTCFFQIWFHILWFHDENEKKNWIKWCDKQPKTDQVK